MKDSIILKLVLFITLLLIASCLNTGNEEQSKDSFFVTIQNGFGDGSYTASSLVTITASDPGKDSCFSCWTGTGASYLQDSTDATSRFLMPSQDISFTAQFRAIENVDEEVPLLSLTVNGGSGDGNYSEGEFISITADNKVDSLFDRWSGLGTQYINDLTSAIAQITMPNENIEISAQFKVKPITQFSVTIVNGSGSGNYNIGDTVRITANSSEESSFVEWTGISSDLIDNKSNSSTRFIMPNKDVTYTAIYQENLFSLIVENGNGSGNYSKDKAISISADREKENNRFSHWTGNGVPYLADSTNNETVVTVPSQDITVKALYFRKLDVSLSLQNQDETIYEGASFTLSVDTDHGDGSSPSYFWKSGGDVNDITSGWSNGSSTKSYSLSNSGEYHFHIKIETDLEVVVKSITITIEELPNEDQYHIHTNISASTFWCGEGASDQNGGITNISSSWDINWGDRFGIEDSPEISRNSDFIPTSQQFKGDENPYYFALPYNDFGEVVYDGRNATFEVANSNSDYSIERSTYLDRDIVVTSDITDWRKGSSSQIPWKNRENWNNKSMVKAQWIRIRTNDNSGNGKWVYAQWADAGPYYYDDVDYVFGSAAPANNTDIPKAGIDLSPSVCLALKQELKSWGANSFNVEWQFVDPENVPNGPWKQHVSDNYTHW